MMLPNSISFGNTLPITRYDRAVNVSGRLDGVVSRPFIIACDWNGTLVDDGDRAWEAASAVLDRLGLRPPERADFFDRWRLPLGHLFEELGVPSSQLDGAVRDWSDELRTRDATLAGGALKMIEDLHSMGGRVGVLSAAAVEVIERDVAQLSLTGILDFVIGDADPKRAAIRAIARRPIQVLYVGDTEYDIIEARAAGVWAIGYGGGYRPSTALAAAGADYVIERLDALPELIRELDGLARMRTGAPR